MDTWLIAIVTYIDMVRELVNADCALKIFVAAARVEDRRCHGGPLLMIARRECSLRPERVIRYRPM